MTNPLTQAELSMLEQADAVLKARTVPQQAVRTATGNELDPAAMELLVAAKERNEKAQVRETLTATRAQNIAAAQAVKEQRRRDSVRLAQESLRLEIEKHSRLPEIPSAAAAAQFGCFPGDYKRFLLLSIQAELSTDMVPNLDESAMEERLAWQLVPAFLNEYAHRYPSMTPRLLVSAWMTAMTTQTASGQLYVRPDELRLVVDEMARDGEQFNPKMMRNRAMGIRIDIEQGNRKAPAVEYPGHYFEFHRSVAPHEFAVSDWATQVDYPAFFPEPPLSDRKVDFANRVVQYRFNTERSQGFTAPMARFLMDNLLTVMIYHERHGTPLSPQHVFGLAYRFSIEFMRIKRPHETSSVRDLNSFGTRIEAMDEPS